MIYIYAYVDRCIPNYELSLNTGKRAGGLKRQMEAAFMTDHDHIKEEITLPHYDPLYLGAISLYV